MLADIHGYAAYIFELRREPDQMRARAEARLALSTESGYAAGRALSEIYLGWADVLAGDLDGGIVRMKRHLSELRAAGFEVAAAYHLALIATALGKAGQFDEAHRTIEESFPIIDRTGQRHCEAEVHRLKGELLLAQRASNAADAEKCFRTAIEIARNQHAKSWELRATTSLARLLAKQRKHDKARTMLDRNLQLVHGGLRYPRPEGCQDPARRTERIAVLAKISALVLSLGVAREIEINSRVPNRNQKLWAL